MIWFTADHHFGHDNIIKYCHRPFDDVGAMDRFLVQAWNEVVAPTDTVYHLGDLSYKGANSQEYIKQLNGRKEIVLGNHDIANREGCEIDLSEFDAVHQGYAELHLDGVHIILCHYPLQTWHDMNKKSIHLHGHCHGKLTKKTRRLDVGVDSHDYRPWSLSEVFQELKVVPKKVEPVQIGLF